MNKLCVAGVCQALVDLSVDVTLQTLDRLAIGKGSGALVSPSEQLRMLENLKVPFRELKPSAAGSLSNTLFAVSALGGSSAIVAKIADDEFGRFYTDELRRLGVTDFTVPALNSSTGTALVLVSEEDGERSMRTSLGVAASFDRAMVDAARPIDTQWMFLEGYLLSCGRESPELLIGIAKHAREKGSKVAISLSNDFIVSGFRAELLNLLDCVDLVVGNASEAKLLTGETDIGNVMKMLDGRVSEALITDGAEGAYHVSNGRLIHMPAKISSVLDTTGAGDAFAGGFLYARCLGLDTERAIAKAIELASGVIAVKGPRISDVLREQWISDIRSGH